jgi:hypothetical protein
MSAATFPIDTPYLGNYLEISLPVVSGATIYTGTLVGLNSSGLVCGMADSVAGGAAILCLGRAQEDVLSGLNAQGAAFIRVGMGVFRYSNDPANPVLQANVGDTVFVLDNQTVTLASTNFIPAGIVVKIESDDESGIWIDTSQGVPIALGAASLAQTSVGVPTTGATNATPYGYAQAQANDIVTVINELVADVTLLFKALNALLRL